MTTTLTNRALLVSLSICQWTARKFDRHETQQLLIRHGVGADAARVNKSLLGKPESLQAIKRKTNAMRWDYYNRSLPWGQEGVNVIRADGYMDFVQIMRDHMYELRGLHSVFLAEYPKLREDARLYLNGMYDENDYPSADRVASKFSCDMKFFPIPEKTDWRVSLSDDEMDELRKQTQDEINRSSAEAMKDAWGRIHKAVAHAIERLSDPKAVFRDSLVENAQELCRVLTSLNITDDPHLERVRLEVETALCSHNPSTLREDPVVRQDVADKMADIMSKMGAFYKAAA